MFYEIDLRMFKNVYKSSTKIFMQVALEISPVSNLRYYSKENASFCLLGAPDCSGVVKTLNFNVCSCLYLF